MPEYTLAAAAAVAAVVALELLLLRSGVFRSRAYWLAMAIVMGFQAIVDGWLTKLSAPIVIYSSQNSVGLRFPWDIPVEDFLYGFALVTLTLAVWERQKTGSKSRRDSG